MSTQPDPPDTPRRTMDLKEFAALMGVSLTLATDQARRVVEYGDTTALPVRVFKIGGRYLIPCADVEALVGQPEAPAPDPVAPALALLLGLRDLLTVAIAALDQPGASERPHQERTAA